MQRSSFFNKPMTFFTNYSEFDEKIKNPLTVTATYFYSLRKHYVELESYQSITCTITYCLYNE